MQGLVSDLYPVLEDRPVAALNRRGGSRRSGRVRGSSVQPPFSSSSLAPRKSGKGGTKGRGGPAAQRAAGVGRPGQEEEEWEAEGTRGGNCWDGGAGERGGLGCSGRGGGMRGGGGRGLGR